MEKLPYDQLRNMLAAAQAKIAVGSKWRHYKGHEYVVSRIVLIEATNELSVLYSDVMYPDVAFVRPVKDWLVMVSWDGQSVARFEQV